MPPENLPVLKLLIAANRHSFQILDQENARQSNALVNKYLLSERRSFFERG